MLSVTEVAEPGLEGFGVVFFDDGAVGDDLGGAGHRGPFAGGVEEGDVDVGVGYDAGRRLVGTVEERFWNEVLYNVLVGLARFGVGVEDEINAASLLLICE